MKMPRDWVEFIKAIMILHGGNIGFRDLEDILVWEYAKTNGFTIVSKNSDFNNLVSYFDFPPKVIWLRRGNCSTKVIIEIITENL